jgi:hypothetical protein
MSPHFEREGLVRGAGVALAGLLMAAALFATQIVPSEIEPIEDLFSRAPVAIEGEVVSHHNEYDERVGALTIWQIKVVEVFKETTATVAPGSVIEFQTMGSEVRDSSELTIGEVGPPIRDGMCAILFLQRSQKNYFQLFELRTTAFFEVEGKVARRAALNHFLPGELSADSLREHFRKMESATRTHGKSK